MKVRTYIINLKDSVERRMSALEETAKYPFMDVEIIEAVNGKIMTDEEIEKDFDVKLFTKRYSRSPVKGEIGCALSHRKCYERLLQSDESYALILEDDVVFIYPEEIEFVLGQGVQLLEQADVILFVPQVVHYRSSQKLNDKYTAYSLNEAYGAFAYLINRRTAQLMLQDQKISWVADDFVFMKKNGVRIKCIYPNVAKVSDAESIIGIKVRLDAIYVNRKRTFSTRLKFFLIYKYRLLLENLGILINRGL